MKKTACLLLACICCLTSCASFPREPEQVYLVSALGFDGGEDGYRISVEVPLIGEKSGIGTKVLYGEGDSIEAALFQVTEGLSKELIYSHCALLILGSTLSRQQLEQVFAFTGKGEHIPLEARTVCAASAKALLEADDGFSTAAGYEIPEIFKRTCESLGIRLRYAIYELRADTPNGASAVIPFFGVSDGENPMATLRGLRILRPSSSAVDLSVEELFPFALLTDRFRGENGGSVSVYPPMEKSDTRLTAELRDGLLCFFLRVNVRSAVPLSENARSATKARIEGDTLALFTRLKNAEGDLMELEERIRKEDPKLYAAISTDVAAYLSTAVLTVECDITGEVQE